MKILKSDQPDFPALLKVEAKDSEGFPTALPDDLNIVATSDNIAAIEVTQDSADKFAFSFHVGGPNVDGTPSQATVTINVLTGAGVLLGTVSESFTVTPGDPASIAVGELVFPTLP